MLAAQARQPQPTKKAPLPLGVITPNNLTPVKLSL